MQVAIILVALIAVVSLGTEIGVLFFISRSMQSAADAAALGAVIAQTKGHPTDYAQEALALAATAGFPNGANGIAVVVNSPSASGNYVRVPGTVEVIITQPQTLALAALVHLGAFNVRARAVADTTGGSCALVLSSNASGAFSMSGGSAATFNGCDLSVNSSSASAASLSGGAVLNARHVYIVGGDSLSGGGAIHAGTGITTSASAATDPYAGYQVPAIGACLKNNYKLSGGSAVLSPGVYCNGMSFSSSATATLSPGVYIIDRGAFSVSGGVSISGTGVTIVLTSSTGANYATASFSGGAIVNLSAPTTGSTAGLVFFQDPRAPKSGTDDLSGGSSVTLTGALYFPSRGVKFSGGNSTGSACMQIVAQTLTLTGGSILNAGCTGTGVLPIGGTAALVE